jgi:hypothetical protein
MRFLMPPGIGDSVWAIHKIQAIAKARGETTIDVGLSCGKDRTVIESRALDFIRRFSFINSVKLCPGYGLLQDPIFTPDGYWNYIPDGMYEYAGEQWCVLIPNAPLERGQRLESWLPNYETNWDIFDHFEIARHEREHALRDIPQPYCVFYPGPFDGNTFQGHNRDTIWRPQDWLKLGERVHDELGLHIVVVGAPYDKEYYDLMLYPNLNGASSYWTNRIGQTNVGELFALTQHARFVISYQAGVGIVSTYLGTPTAIFWRQKGDSIMRDAYLSFEEGMASAWVPPDILESGHHLPLYYGRHDVDYIMREVKTRQWA